MDHSDLDPDNYHLGLPPDELCEYTDSVKRKSCPNCLPASNGFAYRPKKSKLVERFDPPHDNWYQMDVNNPHTESHARHAHEDDMIYSNQSEYSHDEMQSMECSDCRRRPHLSTEDSVRLSDCEMQRNISTSNCPSVFWSSCSANDFQQNDARMKGQNLEMFFEKAENWRDNQHHIEPRENLDPYNQNI